MTLAIYSSPDDHDPTVIVDVTIESSHRRVWDYTQNPVEDGSQMADHYIARPLEISFTGLLSTQRPYLRDETMQSDMMKLEGAPPDAMGAVRKTLEYGRMTGPKLSMLEWSLGSLQHETERPYDQLDGLLGIKSHLLTVVTNEGFFDDMVITQITTRPRGDAIEVSGEMRQIQLGWTAETADVPLAKRSAKLKAKSQGSKKRGKKRVGKKETPPVDAATMEKSQSLLEQLIGQKRIQQAKAAIGG